MTQTQDEARAVEAAISHVRHMADPHGVQTQRHLAALLADHASLSAHVAFLEKQNGALQDISATLSAKIAESEAREGALREAMERFRHINAQAAALGYLEPETWGDEMFAAQSQAYAALTLKGRS